MITLRYELSDLEFSDIQEVKETLRSEILYQSLIILTNLEAENMREILDESLKNPKESVVEKVPYEKEPECVKSTSSILPAPVSELARKSTNTEELDSHTTHEQFTRPICTDSNPRKKNRNEERHNFYTNHQFIFLRDLLTLSWTSNFKSSCKFSNNFKLSPFH
jgi:hypothetical protein